MNDATPTFRRLVEKDLSEGRGWLDRSFALFLGVAIAAIVFYGFGHTADAALIHFKVAPPRILYVHVLLSSAWLILFIVQSALVRSGNVRLHRRLGGWGLGLGTAVCAVGLATAIIMRRLDVALHPHDAGAVAFLSVPFFGVVEFATAFFLAAVWRKRPGLHRRLMTLGTCSLTGPALARIPWVGHGPLLLVISTSLMLAAAVPDWIRARRVHPVYWIGIPTYLLLSFLVVYLAVAAPPAWLAVARFMLQ